METLDNLTFGLTMLLVGMGGTLLTLLLVALCIRGLTALFPAAVDDVGPEE